MLPATTPTVNLSKTLSSIVESTNGSGHIILLFLLAGFSAFGVSEEEVTVAWTALAPIYLAIREVAQKERSVRWNANIPVYVATALGLIFPRLDDVFTNAAPLVNAIVDKAPLNLIIPLVILFVNELLFVIQNNKKEEEEEETPAG